MFGGQQGGGGLMIWAGIIDNTIAGAIRVHEGVKLYSRTYCEQLESVLLPWLAGQFADGQFAQKILFSLKVKVGQ